MEHSNLIQDLITFRKKSNVTFYKLRKLQGDFTIDFTKSLFANKECMIALANILNKHGFDFSVSGVLSYYKGVSTPVSFDIYEKASIGLVFKAAGFKMTA